MYSEAVRENVNKSFVERGWGAEIKVITWRGHAVICQDDNQLPAIYDTQFREGGGKILNRCAPWFIDARDNIKEGAIFTPYSANHVAPSSRFTGAITSALHQGERYRDRPQ